MILGASTLEEPLPINRPLHRALVCLSLLLYLLVGFGSAVGAVLCLADGEECLKDGAKSISCCATPCQETPLCTLTQESCDSCTELLRTERAVKSRTRPLRNLPSQPLAPLPPHLSPLSMHPGCQNPLLLPAAKAPVSTILAQLRTIVLLR
ncbi:hypothetical protein AOP6_0252 [Desulfuromonas sp. AOP6]|nr:hypothetical protein AOP6_0252 [Desulfuromonas sp. AOP6]